jgi:cellulose synthase/poly-beta-1,6-N-acetylglucosamine synthase-like glycosyltransferase
VTIISSEDRVSIIIPCKEIDNYTLGCIEFCQKLDHRNFEIIVLPDNAAKPIEAVTTIPTGPVSPGEKRNIGVKNAKGEFCAFIDNDAYPRSDWLTNALKYLEDKEVGGVGGPGLTPDSDGLMQKAGGYVLSSFMVGSLSNRYKAQGCFKSDDIHSCNFIARKSVVELAGGWNEKYWPGEDTLMCLAIKRTGKKLLECSDIVVYHHRRSLFCPHLKQVSRFGEHRGFFTKKYPENSVKLTYFIPSLLLFSLVAGLILSAFFHFFVFILILGILGYAILSLIASARQAKNAKIMLSVWLGIMVTHLVYGVFFLHGLAKRDLKR